MRRTLWILGSLCAGLMVVGCSGAPVEQRETTAAGPAGFPTDPPAESWRRWGGPGGDFKVEANGLAGAWPADGPPAVWTRPLGEGYSAIASDRGALFTMYREEHDEIVVALDAESGETIWEHRYTARARKNNSVQFGTGPHATPLVLDDRLVTLGYTGALKCLELDTGNVIWSHDLVDDLGGPVLDFGYSASPIPHDGNVIVLVGGERHGLVAFDPADGSVAWSGPPSSVSYATPIVIDVDGQTQLVYFSEDEIIGLGAGDGGKLWSFPVVNEYRNNATDPHWGDDNLLWVAAQLDGGTRALRLTRRDGSTEVEEVWVSNKLSIHYWNTLRLGDHVYASVGSNASILTGVDLRTGEILWRERGFEQVNFVHAGERTILLDSNGQLALAELSPEGMTVHAQAQIVDDQTWTAPTLVGTRLFIRDKKTIRALELAAGQS